MKAPSAPIVAGVDGSASALTAVTWAARESARHRVPLRLVHSYVLPTRGYPQIIITGNEIRQAMENIGREKLAEAAAAARAAAPGVEVVTEIVCGGSTPALVEESKTARLVVVGSQGLGTVTGMIVGSTALALAAHGKSPVVVVRGTEVPGGPVVVGVDGSPTSEAALAFAFETASLRGARLTAVLCWQDLLVESAYAAVPFAVDWAAVEADERRLLAQRLAGWQDKYPDVEVEQLVLRDRPVRAMMRLGAEAQLVVVGSRGHGGFTGMLLGSTSQALVYNAPCPLAIVRPE
ncbi:Nucleotide-binding universal stress protein, UspA family [Lentzea fradiae]|uniref:Nucleotide-binding universal stress protein, UspA family n=1 Tax=Lentzea fradiae TaxID=200378 RepID=A0A1G7KT74_9PSEU|nr:universal stress protein [Lentzea fradiae]SDF40423.1 Nucleotide-binding universal stress protein, UspA family [Lentzea fradiae]